MVSTARLDLLHVSHTISLNKFYVNLTLLINCWEWFQPSGQTLLFFNWFLFVTPFLSLCVLTINLAALYGCCMHLMK